ncbi:anthocyanidin 3-O-glucosyltransferase-like [Amborella trichopoda]|uniref:anthocyanidin 3-O-glucosyltransferase-like n=1 Tax=Amborella trichopoda TaxID=13333 RepID=UPI0005D3550F|nr:anthocyanidin 3-O-glucosyltransferase-like [Amborella trichopoda]|eukprot:XP_011622794.1 anthocyanidin 3-O-glucosyltransferase-like [Amborella trichopoda]
MKPWIEALEWLDRQQNRWVAYLAFGTECVLTPGQIEAVALGARGGWRPLSLVHTNTSAKGARGRRWGKEEGDWCWHPQTKVLEHPAVGTFFTHGGASSLAEGLASGRAKAGATFDTVRAKSQCTLRVGGQTWRTEVSARILCDAVSEADDTETRNAKDLLHAQVFKNLEFIRLATSLAKSQVYHTSNSVVSIL